MAKKKAADGAAADGKPSKVNFFREHHGKFKGLSATEEAEGLNKLAADMGIKFDTPFNEGQVSNYRSTAFKKGSKKSERKAGRKAAVAAKSGAGRTGFPFGANASGGNPVEALKTAVSALGVSGVRSILDMIEGK